ncbi:MAG TPA: hypothetical protein DIU15_06465, partial [Deltaproteobacteria bacterium]|nr:hypothetical protein [Deltaproteobacteria bacterium]
GGGLRVVMLEEGPPRSRFRPSFAHTAKYHMQEGASMLVQGSVPFPVMAGRGVGGGSLVNSAICFRTPENVLESWAESLDDDRYLAQNLAPIYDEIEARIGVAPVSEATAGENNMVIARGAQKLGLEGGLVRRNAPGCIGCGICNYGCPVGGKGSVDQNLILDAEDAGLRLQADCRAEALLVDGRRAVGVVGRLHHPDTKAPGAVVRVRAKLVVLAAGAIGTPRLLWQDGIARDLGPVGEQLLLHPGSGILGVCDHEVHMWKGVTQGAYVWDPQLPEALPHTITAPPEALVIQSGRVGLEAKQVMREVNHLCGLGMMVSDRGVGSVRASRSGRAKLRYEWVPEDVDVLKQGLVLSARVLLAGGAREVFVTAFGAGRHRSAEGVAAELDDLPLHAFQLYSAHPMSTCPMGLDPETSVLNPAGRAHRMDGLYIADAGVFPSSLGVNPQLTTMALATLIGRGILQERG